MEIHMDEVKENAIGISICIPSYNRPEFLKRTLTSIIGQTKKPYEVIVMDDASSEDMSEVKKICKENCFRFINNDSNIGLMKNFNNVIMQATGDYLALVHNDDLLSRYYIEEIEKFIRKYSGYNVYTTNGIGINEKNEVIGEYRLFRGDTLIKKGQGIKKLWAKDYFCLLSVIGCTIYDTKFIQNNPLNSDLGNEADLDKALELLRDVDVMYVDKSIYFTTLHKDQVSYKNKLSSEKLHLYVHNRLDIFKKYAEDFREVPFYLSKIKALHFIQLFLKYKYGVKQAREILKIGTIKEFILILLLGTSLVCKAIYKNTIFLMHKKYINPYLL